MSNHEGGNRTKALLSAHHATMAAETIFWPPIHSSGAAAVMFGYIDQHRCYGFMEFETMPAYAQACLGLCSEDCQEDCSVCLERMALSAKAVWQFFPNLCADYMATWARMFETDVCPADWPAVPDDRVLAALPEAAARVGEDSLKDFATVEQIEATVRALAPALPDTTVAEFLSKVLEQLLWLWSDHETPPPGWSGPWRAPRQAVPPLPPGLGFMPPGPPPELLPSYPLLVDPERDE